MQPRPGRAPRGCPDAQRRRCCRQHRPSRLPMMFYTAAVNGVFAFFCRRAAAHGSRCHAGISAEPAILYHHHPGDLPDPHDIHEREQNGGGWQSKWSVPMGFRSTSRPCRSLKPGMRLRTMTHATHPSSSESVVFFAGRCGRGGLAHRENRLLSERMIW